MVVGAIQENIVDEEPVTAHEIAALVGTPLASTAEPLQDPSAGRLDGADRKIFSRASEEE